MSEKSSPGHNDLAIENGRNKKPVELSRRQFLQNISLALAGTIYLPYGFNPTYREPTHTPPSPTATVTATATEVPPTPEPTRIPEVECRVDLGQRVWAEAGAADPYAPSKSLEGIGHSGLISPKTDGSGWVAGTDRKLFRSVGTDGSVVELLAPGLDSAEPRIPDDVGEVEAITRQTRIVVMEPGTYFEAPVWYDVQDDRPPTSDTTNLRENRIAAYPLLDEFGSPIVDQRAPEAAIQSHITRGVAPDELSQTTPESFFGDDFGPGSTFEIVRGKPFTTEFSLKTPGRGSIILGVRDPEAPSTQQPRFVIALDGQGGVLLADIFADPNGDANVRKSFPTVQVRPGVLEGEMTVSEDRRTIAILIRDVNGESHAVSYSLRKPLGDTGFAEMGVMRRESDWGGQSSRGLAVRFDADPARAAAFVDGTDSHLQRVGALTDRRHELGTLLGHNKLAVPYHDSTWYSIGERIPGMDNLLHHSNGGLVIRADELRNQPSSREQGGSWFYQAGRGTTVLRDGAIIAEIEAIQAQGNPDARAVLIQSLLVEDLKSNPTTDPVDQDEASDYVDNWYGNLNPNIFLDAPIVIKKDGTMSQALRAGVSAEFRPRGQTDSEWAEAFARTVMSKLPEGVEFHGAWTLHPDIPLGDSYAQAVIELIKATRRVPGFHIDQVFYMPLSQPNEVHLASFIGKFNADGIMLGLPEADRWMKIEDATRLTSNQLKDGRDALVSIYDPSGIVERKANPATQLVGKTADGFLEYREPYNRVGAGF